MSTKQLSISCFVVRTIFGERVETCGPYPHEYTKADENKKL